MIVINVFTEVCEKNDGLKSFHLVNKSTVPIRLIPPPVVTKADPLFRLWTQEWQSLTYRIRAILDGDEP
ncbi:hypothetical protein OUZ56_030647 [Daphnia magna]|uniref:Uncharacterized protein n=1 Tax=Daphnia magna TaxID=35525 RepID=A0ABQ9ZRX9_9CRUS|nr:hypothetical protein OUZ56_030647 [Daphnia magna]